MGINRKYLNKVENTMNESKKFKVNKYVDYVFNQINTILAMKINVIT